MVVVEVALLVVAVAVVLDVVSSLKITQGQEDQQDQVTVVMVVDLVEELVLLQSEEDTGIV